MPRHEPGRDDRQALGLSPAHVLLERHLLGRHRGQRVRPVRRQRARRWRWLRRLGTQRLESAARTPPARRFYYGGPGTATITGFHPSWRTSKSSASRLWNAGLSVPLSQAGSIVPLTYMSVPLSATIRP